MRFKDAPRVWNGQNDQASKQERLTVQSFPELAPTFYSVSLPDLEIRMIFEANIRYKWHPADWGRPANHGELWPHYRSPVSGSVVCGVFSKSNHSCQHRLESKFVILDRFCTSCCSVLPLWRVLACLLYLSDGMKTSSRSNKRFPNILSLVFNGHGFKSKHGNRLASRDTG